MKSFVAPFFILALLALATPAARAESSTVSGLSSPQVMQITPPSDAKSPGLRRGETIYFYSFDGTYLRTSAGTIYMPPVKLVNHSAEDLRQVDGSGKKMAVKLTIANRAVRQVDVYPDGEK